MATMMQQSMKLSRPSVRQMGGKVAGPRVARPAMGRKAMNVSASALPLVGNKAPGTMVGLGFRGLAKLDGSLWDG